MPLNRLHVGALIVAAILGANVAYAQDAPEPARHDTTGKAVAGSKTGVVATPRSHAVQVCIDCHGWGRVGDAPAMIIKDATYQVVMMVVPGDTLAVRDSTGDVEPAWIERIDIVKPAAAVAALGRGFEKGILVIVLTPRWQRCLAAAARPTQRAIPSALTHVASSLTRASLTIAEADKAPLRRLAALAIMRCALQLSCRR